MGGLKRNLFWAFFEIISVNRTLIWGRERLNTNVVLTLGVFKEGKLGKWYRMRVFLRVEFERPRPKLFPFLHLYWKNFNMLLFINRAKALKSFRIKVSSISLMNCAELDDL